MFHIAKKKTLVLCLLIMLLVCAFLNYHLRSEELSLIRISEDSTIYKTQKESTLMAQKESTLKTKNDSIPHMTQSSTVSPTHTIFTIKGDDDISCHYLTEGDALSSAEDANFSPPTDSIFFHETSCRGELNSRQACAIESAAKAHPNKTIHVLFSGPITANILNFTRSSIFELKKYPNIVLARVHIKEYAKGTSLEELVKKKTLHSSLWKVSHTSDILRFLTLYKYGGLYLDTDMIVVKPFDDLGRNWLTKETSLQVSCGAVNVAKDELGQEFIGKVLKLMSRTSYPNFYGKIQNLQLREISSSYLPNVWIHNGPDALRRVLSRFCNTTKVDEFSNATCKGIQLYNREKFYPVHYSNFKNLFVPRDQNIDGAYTVHLWNSLSHDVEVQWGSPFDKLAKQYCPVIRELYGDSFGF